MPDPRCKHCGDTGAVYLTSFNCGGQPRQGPPMPCLCILRLPPELVKTEPEEYNRRTVGEPLRMFRRKVEGWRRDP